MTVKLETTWADRQIMAVFGHWEYENEWWLDVDGHPEAIRNTALFDDYDQQTAELRMLSQTGGTVEYIAGLWYQ